MAEYIEREALIKAIDNNFAKLDIDVCNPPYYDGANDEYADVRLIVHKQPAADVQPVKHGHWETWGYVFHGIEWKRCSVCGKTADVSYIALLEGRIEPVTLSLCGCCGARMDAEPDEPWQSD